MKKYLLFVLCTLFFALSTDAARQENDMNQMVVSLHHELMFRWQTVLKNKKQESRELQQMASTIHRLNSESKECALMVYSTYDDAFLDMSFASQSVLSKYRDFCHETAPYVSKLQFYNVSVLRQDSLWSVLKSVDPNQLDQRSRKLLSETFLTLSRLKLHNLSVQRQLKSLYPEYREAYQRLKTTSRVGKQKFEIIRSKVLGNFDDNIFSILSDWQGYVQRRDESIDAHWAVDDILFNQGKAVDLNKLDQNNSNRDYSKSSSWGFVRVVGVFMMIILCFLISVGVAVVTLFLRWLLRRFFPFPWLTYFNKKQIFYLVTVFANLVIWTWKIMHVSGVAFLATIIWQVYYVMVLITIVTFCLTLRYSGRHLGRNLAVCFPTLLSLFYAMYCHIMMSPDDSVVLEVTVSSVVIFILQLVFFLWFNRKLEKTMKVISHMCLWFSLGAMVLALSGLQYLSNMVTIFWSNLLTVIILLETVKHFIDLLAGKHGLLDRGIGKNWWLLLIRRVLYPMAWIYAILGACNLACMVYSLNEFLDDLLATNFNTPIGNITLNVNLVIFICWNYFVASYLSSLISHLSSLTTLSIRNVIKVLIWGLAAINIMMAMGFSMQWVGISFAGLSTGIGFASREIIENVIYGLALRNGYMKLNDWVVSDGIRGQVKNIGILSTRLDSVEGTVLTIANERLFHRDFENITLNHGYELLHTMFSIDYGEDIEKVRKVLIDGYQKYDCYDKERPVTVYSKKFADSWIDMDFRVWVPADQYIRLSAFNVEYVYNTLTAHNINFPYPVLTLSSPSSRIPS